MGINTNLANSQASSLNYCADELREIRNNILSYKNTLNSLWMAQEMAHVNIAIDRILAELGSLIADLPSVASDIGSSAREIKAAEERAAREKAERARRERERRDRESNEI